MKRIENLKFKIENYGISLLLVISSLFKRKAKTNDIRKMEFSASTQKMGVSFTDKIRNVFRGRWVRKAQK